MRKQIGVFVLVAALFALSALPSLAQDEPYCSELSEDDCTLLYDSAEASLDILSASGVANVSIAAQNLPEVPYSDLSFALVMETSSSSSQEAVDAALNLDPQMVEDDPEAFAEALGEIFAGTALDASMDVTFSDDLVTLIESEGEVAWPENVVLNLRFVDGDGFVDLDALTESVPELAALIPAELNGWIGAELGKLTQEVLATTGTDPNTQASLDGVSVGSQSTGPLLTQLAPLDPTGEALDFLVVERGEDMIADGEEAATFVYSFDLTGFVSSDLYGTVVEASLASQGEMPSAQEIAEIVSVSRLVAPLLANSLDLELVETVGTESGYHYGSNFLLALDLTELIGVASSFGAIEPLDVEGDSIFELAVTTSNFDINEEVEIEAPEDTGVYTAEQLMGLLELSGSLQ